MNHIWLIVFLFLFSFQGNSQELDVNSPKGEFSLGMRTTGSVFSASGNNFGLGTGGQFRLRISEKVNTEWFADWIVTNLGGLGQRYDAHIGESMFIYFSENVGVPQSFTPYLLGGFCADYTQIETIGIINESTDNLWIKNADRWSFATQLGLGAHYNFTRRFDFSLTAQYVLHFGDDLHSEVGTDSFGNEYLYLHQETGGGFEGHLFFSLSANYILVDLIKTK